MKKNKMLFLAAVTSLTMGILCGCGAAQEQAKNEAVTEAAADGADSEQTSGISFTDMSGKEITLDEPVTKIVALTASDCEILYAIGAGDALVGRGEYCDYPAEVLDVPSIQSGHDTNVEQIISLNPQVLLMSTMAQTKEQIEAVESAGIKVVVSDAQDIDGVYTAVEMIGKLMGKEENAAKIVGEMKSTFNNVSAKASELKGKKVYFEVSPLQYGLWAAGKGTFMNEVADMIGLENIFADVDGWAEISEEQVIERAPDYIVTIAMYFGEGDTPVDEIKKRAGWDSIPAIANDRILNLANNELSRPGPRLADGAQALYDFVSGD